MKKLLSMFVAISLSASSACTTLQSVEASPDEVQRLIVEENILEPDTRARLVTVDETVYEIRVTAVDLEHGLVISEDERIPIEDIIAVDTREVSVGRTALLIGGLGYGVAALIAIAIAPAILLGGG